jgi:hypothetical protein
LAGKVREPAPLTPLTDVIREFKKRSRILSAMMFISLPAGATSMVLFLVFFMSSLSLPISTIALFAVLALSAIISYLAVLIVPSTLQSMIVQIETLVRNISFMIVPPRGDTPQEKILNQLSETDTLIKKTLEKNPGSARMNAGFLGSGQKEYVFDVFIHDDSSRVWKFLRLGYSGVDVFVKRFEETEISKETIAELKNNVQNILRKAGKKVPSRVFVVSTLGYDDSAFLYVNSKEGIFRTRFPAIERKIGLVKENTDGTFDVLTF